MTWPPTADGKRDAIRAVWKRDIPAVDIAACLGTTKRAIIGVYFRSPQLRATHPLRDPEFARRDYRGYNIRLNRTLRKPVEPRQMKEPHTAPMTLMGVCTGRCRWPVTETGPHLFCCQPCEGTYCEAHRKMATQAPQTRGEALATKEPSGKSVTDYAGRLAYHPAGRRA